MCAKYLLLTLNLWVNNSRRGSISGSVSSGGGGGGNSSSNP